MQPQFTVDPEELDRAGAIIEQQAEDALTIKTRLEAVRLSSGDFGYVLGMGNVCWKAYRNHVDACGTSLDQLSASLGTVAATTRATAAAYRGLEEENLIQLRQMLSPLNDAQGDR